MACASPSRQPDRELPLILGADADPAEARDRRRKFRQVDAEADDRQRALLYGSQVRPGEAIVLKRNPDYWAKDLPSKRGFDNFDEIRIDYFRDANAMFEAFKKGAREYPDRERSGAMEATGYDFPAVNDGRVVKDTFETGLPSGMLGFVFNTRRAVFKNPKVRAALARLFDFEWANRNLFAGRLRAHGQLFRRFGALASSGFRPARRKRRCWSPTPAPSRPRSWTAHGAAGLRRQRPRQGIPAQGLSTR